MLAREHLSLLHIQHASSLLQVRVLVHTDVTKYLEFKGGRRQLRAQQGARGEGARHRLRGAALAAAGPVREAAPALLPAVRAPFPPCRRMPPACSLPASKSWMAHGQLDGCDRA